MMVAQSCAGDKGLFAESVGISFIVNAWKDINEDCMRPTNAPMLLLQHFVNLVRVTDVIYENDDDSYTIPLGLKDYVALLYIEQLPLCE